MHKFIFKKLFFCLVLLFTLAINAQFKARIIGKIILSDNSVAENISVALKGTSHGTSTNSEGLYEIKNIKPGTYTLRISAIGIATVEEQVTVGNGEAVIKNIVLTESREQLDEVIIEGNLNRYKKQESTSTDSSAQTSR